MEAIRELAQRLKEARNQLGLTQEEAAARLGIRREYLSVLESGKRQIPLRFLHKASRVYGVPTGWFYGSGAPRHSFGFLLRQGESLFPESRAQLVRFQHLAEAIAELRRMLGISPMELPQYPLTPELLEKQARDAAISERARLGLDDDPIPNLGDLLEEQGVAIIRLPMKSGELSGAMAYDQELGGFILINANEAPTRQLWTIAHEYAHLLKDAGKGYSAPEVIDESGRALAKLHLMERFANRFAAHFLMPEDTLKRIIEFQYEGNLNYWSLISLRQTFGVSFEALLHRLIELKYFTRKEITRWNPEKLRQLEKRFFDQAEPRQRFMPSRTLWELAITAVWKEKISAGYCAEVLGISEMEVTDILFELEEVHLSEQTT